MPDQANAMRVLQLYLRDTGRYAGDIDGDFGPQTRNAILQALEDGPDTALTLNDYIDSGGRLGCNPANVMAFAEVEAAGAGFSHGYPKILFEPHRFCKLTQGRFSGNHPSISYQVWGTRPYPSVMEERYNQLLEAVSCDVAAGFSAASYGKFQIMGENHEACGYDNSWTFAFAMAFDEQTQLKAFESFVRKTGILPSLQNGNWVECARRYNGTAYLKNRYDVRLAQAARKWELQLEGRTS
jgi:hypothetical protein